MKLISILMFVFCFQVAAKTSGQTVHIKANNVSIISVLKEIQQQTGYNIMAEQALLENTRTVSVAFNNISLDEALQTLLKGTSLSFTIQNKTIILKAEKDEKTNLKTGSYADLQNPAPIAVLPIEGKVMSADGVPLENASIYNQNTKRGTTSKKDGSFVIDGNIGDVLFVSYIGYKAKPHKVISSSNNTIQLEEAERNLEEFVATGYQNIRKPRMTGATSTVKAEDLLNNGTNTIEQMLQGKLPGVEVVSNSGLVGSRQTVRVRGVSTLLGNQEPLWVVDGIIQEDPLPFQAKELNRFNQEPSNSESLRNFVGSAISWLNPYDIEDVTVLKDAASTAIYGVKAANGVILINTKRGKNASAPVVSYSGSFSTQTKPSYYNLNLMNSKERVDVSREIWERGLVSVNHMDNVGYSGLLKQYLENKLSYDDFNTGVKQLEVNNTNWFDILFQQPLNQSHNISVSGGGDNNTYYGSFGINDQKGSARGNGQKSYQGSINFTSNITRRLKVSAKVAGSYTQTTGFRNVDPYM
ncbi:MAG: TonB-dependent receptor plug domain-containing protein [Sphingobacteriales bacterium]|nr:TonB-dependent receptor plug domain-containing protein [Sphingobacteriales bacterium]